MTKQKSKSNNYYIAKTDKGKPRVDLIPKALYKLLKYPQQESSFLNDHIIKIRTVSGMDTNQLILECGYVMAFGYEKFNGNDWKRSNMYVKYLNDMERHYLLGIINPINRKSMLNHFAQSLVKAAFVDELRKSFKKKELGGEINNVEIPRVDLVPEKLKQVLLNSKKTEFSKKIQLIVFQSKLSPAAFLLECGHVMSIGAMKYGVGSWRTVPDAVKRYTAAAERHLIQGLINPINRADGGLNHWAQAAINLGFIEELKS